MTTTELQPGGKPVPYSSSDRDRFYAAFVSWEAGWRAAPESYRSLEEIAALGLDQVSAERADHFFALLNGEAV